MSRNNIVSAMIVLALPVAAVAQAGFEPTPFASRADIALGYNYIRANAPPGGDPKFNANGGFLSVGIYTKYHLSVVGEVSGARANNISSLGQNLTLFTYQGGPRLTFRKRRSSVFVQGLVGGAHGSDSYFPTSTGSTTSASSLAYGAGGGFDYLVSSHWAARVQGEYLHLGFPNGVNDSEHHLSLGIGVVYRFHGHNAPKSHAFSNAATVDAQTATAAPLAPALAPEPAPAPTPEPAPTLAVGSAPTILANDQEFHDNVRDVFFGYNSAALRPDTKTAIAQAADYLKVHSEIHVAIGGYADERGAMDYNLALGSRRASAAMEALVAAGIDPARLSTATHGKEVQVCTEDDEACWKQNRRAAFTPRR